VCQEANEAAGVVRFRAVLSAMRAFGIAMIHFILRRPHHVDDRI
jgi:hypothetical protein